MKMYPLGCPLERVDGYRDVDDDVGELRKRM